MISPNVQSTVLSSTFDFWRNRTNELAEIASKCAVTTDNPLSNTSQVSAAAVGNAAITGKFTANAISIGNSTVNVYISSTPSLTISNTVSNVSIGVPTVDQRANNFHLAANGSWTYVSVSNGQVVLNNSDVPDAIDAYPMNLYMGAEYLLSVKDTSNNASNSHYLSKILTVHDGSNAMMTEYGAITTNTKVGVFTTATNTTHVILYFSANVNVTNSIVNYVRTVI